MQLERKVGGPLNLKDKRTPIGHPGEFARKNRIFQYPLPAQTGQKGRKRREIKGWEAGPVSNSLLKRTVCVI